MILKLVGYFSKGGVEMTVNAIFNEWAEDLPPQRKVQVAQELLFLLRSGKLTPNEQKIAEDAKQYLLQHDK